MFEARSSDLEKLPHLLLTDGLIDPGTESLDLRIDLSFGFELGKNLRSKVAIAFVQRLCGPLDARLDSCAVESIDGLVTIRLL